MIGGQKPQTYIKLLNVKDDEVIENQEETGEGDKTTEGETWDTWDGIG
jgi:hypothetical protein